jgi:cytochrome c5
MNHVELRTSKFELRASAVIFGLAIALAGSCLARASTAQQTTVKDKVYTKAQAAAGETLFTKTCAKCHALKDGGAALEGPQLGGDAFLTKWEGKSVYDLALAIRLTMPPDGSIAVSEDQAADLVAHILKTNGFADGPRPLKVDTSARALLITKIK